MVKKKISGELVGILGGMGPLATAYFYEKVIKLTCADKDQDHIPLIINNIPDVPDRTKAIESRDYEPVLEKLEDGINQLQSSGCTKIACTCNTAHFFLRILSEKMQIPIIDMIELTGDHILNKFNSKCENLTAIFATDGTIKSCLYQSALDIRGVPFYVPNNDEQKLVMTQIYDCIKAGRPYNADLWDQLIASVKEKGVTSIIMGCTELSVIKDENHLGDLYIDPMDILAREVIRISGGTTK